MNSWQSMLSRAGQWYRSRPARQRHAMIGALAAVSLLILVAQSDLWPRRMATLFPGRELSGDEIGAMEIAFGQSSLNDYRIEGSGVSVPAEERARYLKALAEHSAVPEGFAGNAAPGSGLEFLQSREQQRQQALERKKQSIRELVQQLGFVQRATVDYDEARGHDPFSGVRRTAIVTVQPRDGQMLCEASVGAVRDTVCGAVAGLEPAEVTVVDIQSNRSWAGKAPVSTGPLQAHVAARLFEEKQYEQKIRDALVAYPGVRVNVEVAIDPVVKRVRDERTIDSDVIPSVRTVQSETTRRNPGTSSTPSSSQIEVFNAGANGQARVAELDRDVLSHVQTERTESLAGTTFESVETSGLTVSGVNVSIGVPESCVAHFVERLERSGSLPNHAGSTTDDHTLRSRLAFEQVRADILQKIGPLIPEPAGAGPRSSEIVVTIDPQFRPVETLSPIASLDDDGARPVSLLLITGCGLILALAWASRFSGRSSSHRNRFISDRIRENHDGSNS